MVQEEKKTNKQRLLNIISQSSLLKNPNAQIMKSIAKYVQEESIPAKTLISKQGKINSIKI